jgi:hypothetical protein
MQLIKTFEISLIVILLTNLTGLAQPKMSPADPEYYAMDREDIRFEDSQILLVNYRGYVSPRQYSLTQFTNVQFEPFEA